MSNEQVITGPDADFRCGVLELKKIYEEEIHKYWEFILEPKKFDLILYMNMLRIKGLFSDFEKLNCLKNLQGIFSSSRTFFEVSVEIILLCIYRNMFSHNASWLDEFEERINCYLDCQVLQNSDKFIKSDAIWNIQDLINKSNFERRKQPKLNNDALRLFGCKDANNVKHWFPPDLKNKRGNIIPIGTVIALCDIIDKIYNKNSFKNWYHSHYAMCSWFMHAGALFGIWEADKMQLKYWIAISFNWIREICCHYLFVELGKCMEIDKSNPNWQRVLDAEEIVAKVIYDNRMTNENSNA